MYTFNVFSVVLLLLLNFCNTARADLQEEIKARQLELEKLFNAGDVEGAANLYDENAVFMLTGKEPAKGRAAIGNFFKSDQDADVATIEPITEVVEGSGDWAFERGTFDVKSKDGRKTGDGMYLMVWKKQNGQWFIYADSTNYINKP